MKKRKILLSFVIALFTMCCLSACKEKQDSTTPSASTPHVVAKVQSGPYYIGDALPAISCDADTEGSIAWSKPDSVLLAGSHEYGWLFTPDDTTKYTTVSGMLTLVAVERPVSPNVSVSVIPGTFYEDTTLGSSVQISYTPTTVAGTLQWSSPNTKLALGTHSYSWRFVPTDTAKYTTQSGQIEVTAIAQTLESISVKTQPTTTSGYRAFDEFNDAGLELQLNYNAGKVETITSGWTTQYALGDCLMAGDTSVTVVYQELRTQVNISEVGKFEVTEPEISASFVYDGTPHTSELSVASEFYTASPVTQTNAGSYPVEVTLTDPANTEWKKAENKTSSVLTIQFVINKTELSVVETNYSGDYDANAHSATVSSEFAAENGIYYSLSTLNADNYMSGSKTPIGLTDVGNYVVYYYVVGDQNHNDKAGELSVQINKQTPNIVGEYCYAVASDKVSNYPDSYVKITDSNAGAVESENLSYTYALPNGNPTTPLKGGAATEGGAPKDPGTYVVKIHYAGSNNYNEAVGTGTLYIDRFDNGFYSTDTSSDFAFKQNPDSYDSTNNYIKFLCQENSVTHLKEIVFDAMFSGEIIKGNLIYNGNYKIVYEATDGTDITTVEKNVVLETLDSKSQVTIDSIVYGYWVVPKFVGTYKSDNATVQDAGEDLYSWVEIHDYYGSIAFTLHYSITEWRNFEESEIVEGGDKGEEYIKTSTILGLVSMVEDISVVGGHYNYLVFHFNKNSDGSLGSACFVMRWKKSVSADNPQSLELICKPKENGGNAEIQSTNFAIVSSYAEQTGKYELDGTYSKQPVA